MAYANNIALLAEDEEEMRGMIKRLERYLERNKMELSVEKTNVMRCRKGGRRKKIVWRWKEKGIEEVKEFRY